MHTHERRRRERRALQAVPGGLPKSSRGHPEQRACVERLLSRALERRLAAEAARLEHVLRGACMANASESATLAEAGARAAARLWARVSLSLPACRSI